MKIQPKVMIGDAIDLLKTVHLGGAVPRNQTLAYWTTRRREDRHEKRKLDVELYKHTVDTNLAAEYLGWVSKDEIPSEAVCMEWMGWTWKVSYYPGIHSCCTAYDY